MSALPNDALVSEASVPGAISSDNAANGSKVGTVAVCTPAVRRLFDLPLGSRFRYQGKPTVYVLLSYADSGLVGDNPHNEGLRRPFQGLYSAAESRAEFEALMVEFVPVVEATSQEGGSHG